MGRYLDEVVVEAVHEGVGGELGRHHRRHDGQQEVRLVGDLVRVGLGLGSGSGVRVWLGLGSRYWVRVRVKLKNVMAWGWACHGPGLTPTLLHFEPNRGNSP